MKKLYPMFALLLFVLSVNTHAQNIISSRMNEVFLKTDLSGSGVLNSPWEITYGPDDSLWITDARAYKVYKMSPVSPYNKRLILDISPKSTWLGTTPASDSVFNLQFTYTTYNPQGGLAGLAIHPDFMNITTPKKYVYISYVRSYVKTVTSPANGGTFFLNRVVRFTYNTTTGKLDSPVSLCDTLPGSTDHNSQRVIIAPVNGVNYLFYAQGDMGAGQLSNAMRTNNAQNTLSYEGKILRFNLESDGDAGLLDRWIPNDNPYGAGSAIWCMGIRNNQGLAYDSVRNILYGSSHGPYSDDEVNILEPLRNYGHPLVIGYAADSNYNGASAGAHPASASTLAMITDEAAAAAAIGPSYKDPLLTAYPSTQHVIDSIWTNNPGNNGWPSEAWSGLGLYNYSVIPGWKNSLLMAGLKWGRVIRTKLDNTGKASLPSGTMADTVIYFDGTPRYRDMAFGPGGKDIYLIMDNSNSGASPAGTGTNNPLLPQCLGCVQRFTFLGYNALGGTSTISPLVAIASGKPNMCEDANTITVNAASSNNNLWVPITDTSGNIVAEINANGNNLGTVTTSVYTNNGPVREQAGTKTLYLDRNITITPQTQPSTPVSVRIYLNNAEFTALKNGINSGGQPTGISTVTDLSIYKNSDPCGASIVGNAPRMATTNQAAFGSGGYVLQTDVSSFSTFYVSGVTALLPVHSLTFNGSISNNIGQLRWTTEDETGTKLFTVERSTNSRNFYPIGNITASSVSGQAFYAFPDSAVTQLSSTFVYYRLKLTDADGRFSYSAVVVLKQGAAKAGINIRPNPVINEFTVDINAVVADKANWQLTDITGKTVMQRPVSLSMGNNEININIGSLPAGVYYLKVMGNNINQSVKLQKL